MIQTTTPKMPVAKLPAIDVLRGLAATSVVVYHAKAELWEGFSNLFGREHSLSLPSLALRCMLAPFSYGYLGVTLFFVISGFCIHFRQALGHKNSSAVFSREGFAKARFKRIYPTYLAALLLSGLVAGYLTSRGSSQIPDGTVSWQAFAGSLTFVAGLATPFFGNNTVFWSLVLEVHLYAIYAIFYPMAKKSHPTHVLLNSAIASAIAIIMISMLDLPSRLPYWHSGGSIAILYLFTFVIGAYAAEIYVGNIERSRILRGPTGVVAFLVAIGIDVLHIEYLAAAVFLQFGYAIAFGSLLLFILQLPQRLFTQGLLARIASIGVMSYSLYAIHRPVLESTKYFVCTLGGESKTSLSPLIIGVLASLFVASTLFYSVERFSIRRVAGQQV